ncbi:MAG: flagellar motor protein MotA [Alphaproteobacteria bacterium]
MRPTQYLVRIVIFLAALALLTVYLADSLQNFFAMNTVLNSVILGVIVVGILHALRHVVRIYPESKWLEAYRERRNSEASHQKPPRILVSVANTLSQDQPLSSMTVQSLLDGVATRLDESRETGRYLIGLSVFLGLLGTFWGLSLTLQSVSDVITSLPSDPAATGAMFDQLKSGLAAPLTGMGLAFSSSLFGLAGSLILGFIELQASQAGARFYSEIEEWLMEMSKNPLGSNDSPLEAALYTNVLLEQTAENIDTIQRTMSQSHQQQEQAQQYLLKLVEQITLLVETRQNEQQAQDRITNIEALTTRFIDESSSGRKEALDEIRSEMRMISKSILALNKQTPSPAAHDKQA